MFQSIAKPSWRRSNEPASRKLTESLPFAASWKVRFMGVNVASLITSSKRNIILPESRSIVYESKMGRVMSGVKIAGWWKVSIVSAKMGTMGLPTTSEIKFLENRIQQLPWCVHRSVFSFSLLRSSPLSSNVTLTPSSSVGRSSSNVKVWVELV